tara:strand:+ start:4414 stop:6105 length:1692 start_codon:yes stop_codon:yes gene_type:complete
MIKKTLYIFIFCSFALYSQNNDLRIEIIDVFKEYTPSVKKSFKISNQPTFLDTLKTKIVSNKSILKKNLLFTEITPVILSSQFRFMRPRFDYQKYLSLSMGNQSFLNTRFHYTNGLSTRHNAGVYFEHESEDYLINQSLDGGHTTSLQAYSDWFLSKMLLSSVFIFDNHTGFYWADLENYSTSDVKKYIGNNFEIKLHLDDNAKNRVLNNVDLNMNYFFNNFGRSEFVIAPSVSFALEQALRQYFFNVDAQITHTIFNHSLDNQFHPFDSLSDFSDVLINSKLLMSGSKFVDYIIGLNFQYLTNDDVVHGGDPLVFPEIKLSKTINKNHKIDFNVRKTLIYNSFSKLFSNMPYVAPYYKNSLLKQFQIAFSHTAKLHEDISVSSALNYTRERGSLIPFVVTDSIHSLSEFIISPLAIYSDSLQSGVGFSTSLSLDKPRYNILLDGTLSFISSKKYNNKQFVPKLQLNSLVRFNITDNFHIISNYSWVGKRDVLIMHDVYDLDVNQVTKKLDSYFQIDMSFSYNIKDVILSLEFENILNQKIDFYDGYYDDNGVKIHLGCAYKF